MEIRLPQEGEILGIGLIRHSSMAGPLAYFCFEGEVRYVWKKHGFRCAIIPVFENELVLINKKDNTLIHKYTLDEIKILTEKMLLMDLPSIIGLSEQERKKRFDKSLLEESAKTRVGIMGIYLSSKLGFDVFISHLEKDEKIPAKLRMDNFLSMYEDLSGKYMYIESHFANEKTELKNDYFGTLLDLDEKLNMKGYKIICNGTSWDVWPIGGAQRDFYKGLIGYRWLEGRQDTVNIFDVGGWIQYSTTKEHTEIFNKKWGIGNTADVNKLIITALDILKSFFSKDNFDFDEGKFSECISMINEIYNKIPENSKLVADSMTEEIHSRLSAVFYTLKEENTQLKSISLVWVHLENLVLFMDKLRIIEEAGGHGYGPDSTKRAFTSICYELDLLKDRDADFKAKLEKIKEKIKSSKKDSPIFILEQAIRVMKSQ